jgi:transposase
MARPQQAPLRRMLGDERASLEQVARAGSERAERVRRAAALLAVAAGGTFREAARCTGHRRGATIARVVARFNRRGLASLTSCHRGGPPRRYGPAARERILREFRRPPDRERDGTATWSLTTLQRALRRAPDGLPRVSTWTIRQVLGDAGYSWQQSRTWCPTGTALRKRKDGTTRQVRDPEAVPKQAAIERAYRVGEQLGLQVWCQDEAGPYQAIPHPGSSWQPEGHPGRRPHEYVRGGTAKLLTLFRPATGEVRAEPVEHATNAVLHPWLQRELTAILAHCPPVPAAPHPGRRWADWDWHPDAATWDGHLPPLRVLLIWDNLRGHLTPDLLVWCLWRGILPLYTPLSGSWLNMAESVQRILAHRALDGQHPRSVPELMAWLAATVRGWNAAPTSFEWGGKRAARRERARARARRYALAGSGACAYAPLRRVHLSTVRPSKVAARAT